MHQDTSHHLNWTNPRDHKPVIVIVSGRPGSGKTTMARILAQTLLCPLISRDEIYEGIFHTLRDELARKDLIATTAFHSFFSVIELLVSAKAMLVAEAAFQDHRWRAGLGPIAPISDIKIIHCVVDAQLAHQRVIGRNSARSSPAQSTQVAAASQAPGVTAAALRPFQPLSLPIPSLNVATSDGYDPGLDQILAFIKSC